MWQLLVIFPYYGKGVDASDRNEAVTWASTTAPSCIFGLRKTLFPEILIALLALPRQWKQLNLHH